MVNIVDDYTIIGNIDFSDCLNEKYIENSLAFSGIGVCSVKVNNGDEGQIPHFHIDEVNGSFKTCICIYSANYFNHNKSSSGVFNSAQRKTLDSWLRNSCHLKDAKVGESNWEYIARFWEDNFGKTCKFPNEMKVSKQPDYKNMSSFRSR